MHAGLSVPCCACWAAADVEAVEEDLEQEEEDGIKLEAFNLKARPPWVLGGAAAEQCCWLFRVDC